jgi:hypothetical protein
MLLRRFLHKLSIFLQLCWAFFPGILLLIIAYVFFSNLLQGKDILITGLRSKLTGLLFTIALFFWVLVTWYTSRLIAYNNDKLFRISKDGLYHTPRVLGYACFTVLIIALTLLVNPIKNIYAIHLGILFVSTIVYLKLHPIFEKIKNAKNRSTLLNIRYLLWILFFVIVTTMIYIHTITSYILGLALIQIGYLFLVITRRKISETEMGKDNSMKLPLSGRLGDHYKKLIHWLFTDKEANRESSVKTEMIEAEKHIFFWFSLFSLAALIIYITAVSSLSFARYISPLPIILLSFGILLGGGNIISLFSIKQKINFHFLFIITLIVLGYVVETHYVSLEKTSATHAPYAKRPSLRQQFLTWTEQKKVILDDTAQKEFPVFLVLADGGASRSAYWTASVLSTIDNESKGAFSNNLLALSGASGGCLGNLAFIAARKNQYRESSLNQIQAYLSNDFLSFPLARLLGPDLILPFLPERIGGDRARALEQSLKNVGYENPFSVMMKKRFSELTVSSDSSFDPIIAINCTRMQDGAPAVISNIQIDEKVFGKRIDVLGLLKPDEEISVASAVVLGARFPYFSPAGRIQDQYFVDGGYFDNSGAGVAHEMILELQELINDSIRVNPSHSFGKIRFHVVHITNQPKTENKITKTHPLINDLAAPVKTILGSYTSQTDINNLRLFKYLLGIYNGDTTYHSINLYKENEEDVYPMNWSISNGALKKMNLRLKENEKINALVSTISNTKTQ